MRKHISLISLNNSTFATWLWVQVVQVRFRYNWKKQDMSKQNKQMKTIDQDLVPESSSYLDESKKIPEEIFDIAKLLAHISVDEYLKGKLQ